MVRRLAMPQPPVLEDNIRPDTSNPIPPMKEVLKNWFPLVMSLSVGFWLGCRVTFCAVGKYQDLAIAALKRAVELQDGATAAINRDRSLIEDLRVQRDLLLQERANR